VQPFFSFLLNLIVYKADVILAQKPDKKSPGPYHWMHDNKKTFRLQIETKGYFRGATLFHLPAKGGSDALRDSVTGMPVRNYSSFIPATPRRVRSSALLPRTRRQLSENVDTPTIPLLRLCFIKLLFILSIGSAFVKGKSTSESMNPG
jgi:hypothetical protein